MAGGKRKRYMKKYNQKPEVKAKKAEYMRLKRSEEDRDAARRLVSMLLEHGFEDLAEQYALERCPEMLITAKVRRK
jgi:hypothetical protein